MRRPMIYATFGVLVLVLGWLPVIAQDGPVPLGEDRPSAELPSRLTSPETTVSFDIGYLATLPRGQRLWLRMMSGVRIEGRLVNVKDESGVVVLELPGDGQPRHGCYKPAAIEGVEY